MQPTGRAMPEDSFVRIVERCSRFGDDLPRTRPGMVVLGLAVVLLGVGMAAIGSPQAPAPGTPSPPSVRTGETPQPRAREGTDLVDQPGSFQIVGERVVFVTEKNSQRFVALENLNLERIARTLASHPYPLQWRVSGKITEFRGNNFILVERAIGKASSTP